MQREIFYNVYQQFRTAELSYQGVTNLFVEYLIDNSIDGTPQKEQNHILRILVQFITFEIKKYLVIHTAERRGKAR